MAVVAPPGTQSSTVGDKQSVPPNQSLYIQNLPEKLQKDDLKRALYMLFSPYGPVVDITALKTRKMRGQAHVLFKDVPTANQAMRQCQGFDFFGREMKISYSRNRSNTLAKMTGTFNQSTAAEQPKQAAQAPSSFAAPPGTGQPAPAPAPPTGLPPPPGLPAKVNGETSGLKAPQKEPEDVASPQGTKRAREESDDEVPMDEDDDDDDEGGEMEMSDDDD